MAKDLYAILGLPANATDRQIREQFLELARSRHPDLLRGRDRDEAEREFQAITEAFNILSDPEKRRQHDLERARPVAQERMETGQAARVYLRRGVKAYREKNYLEAADNFDRATVEDPKDAQAWHYLAMACSHRRTWLARALKASARACELEPMNAGYLKLAGDLAARAGQIDRAVQLLQEALTWGGEDEQIRAAIDDLKKSGKKPRTSLFGRGG